MSKHTKEPRFHHAASGSQHCAGGYINASKSRSDHAIAHICGSGFECGEYQANARRIVACVNACAGLPTEQLESSPLGGVLNGVAGLIAQRDELLAALEGVLAVVGDSTGVAGYHLNGAIADWDEFDEINAVYTAIAKAKGNTVAEVDSCCP